MINLEIPAKLQQVQQMAQQLAAGVFRPIARKYDAIEHCDTPEELKPVAQMMAAMPRGSGGKGGGDEIKNGSNMTGILAVEAMCWGDVGLMLSIPGSGLGNAAVMAVGTPEQKEKYGKLYCAMAITEPGAGSDSAAVSTTAELDGDEWVLNGEKIYCTAGQRCDAVVVWATLDKSLGKAAIKSFIVPRDNPGLQLVRVEDKMGLRVSDTAALSFNNCRIPKDHILGSAEIGDTEEARKKAFGAMGRIAPDLLVQDATVPRTKLPEVLAGIDDIGSRYGLKIANVFHAGDGNLHPNILFDRQNQKELELVERASKEIMQLCVDAGGTITGEHGVGLDKREYMTLVYGPAELQAMAAAKQVFDPDSLFNPGKVLPEVEGAELGVAMKASTVS